MGNKMKHKHAELMMQYAQDAMETDKPWELWEMRFPANESWSSCTDGDMHFSLQFEYRHKPKMINVTLMDGEVVRWPAPHRTELEYGDTYYFVDVDGSATVEEWDCVEWDKRTLADGRIHLTKEAAEQHSYALFKINNQVAKWKQ